MGRPPTHGAPSFRFFHSEVAQMETLLREHGGHVPPRELLMALANKFSNSQERSGKITVQMKQVWNWFQNRRYALRSKLVKSPGNPNMPPNPRDEVSQTRNVPTVLQQTLIPSGHIAARNTSENPPMEFEAKSARDGAWYDVQVFLSHRYLETGNPEVLVRFSGFGPEEDEWVNVRKLVRQRSLPCESSECVAVLPGDLILCFQEGKEQALYFDAHVLDAQRRRHDVRGCRCRFLVRYDHDQTEEIVPLRKVCRRPETDFRLQQLHGANESASTSTSVSAESKKSAVDPNMFSTLRVTNPNHSAAVTVPPPTITNVAATTLISPPIPAPISVPILSSVSTPISAPTPSSSLTSASTQISAQSSTPIFAPTPSLNLTSAPSPSLASVASTTPSSTLIFAPSSSSTPNFAPTPSSAPISAPASSSTPISAPAPSSSPISAPAPSSSPISAAPPIPVSGPSPTPISDPSPSSTPISAAAPSPSSTPISAAAPSPAVVSAPSPTPISAPSPTLNSAATASSISVSTSTLAPASAPSLSPVIAPAPTTTTTGPVSISSHTTVTAPESKIPETDCSGTSTGIASARDKIMNSGAAVAVMEAKEEEIHSNPETSVVIESNIPVEEMSDNAAVAVPEPEKVGISVPSEPTVTISASTTDGGQPVSTVAEGGSVTDKD